MAVDRCALWRPDHIASHSATLSPIDGLIFLAVNSRSFRAGAICLPGELARSGRRARNPERRNLHAD
jgi:hypothetical protein